MTSLFSGVILTVVCCTQALMVVTIHTELHAKETGGPSQERARGATGKGEDDKGTRGEVEAVI